MSEQTKVTDERADLLADMLLEVLRECDYDLSETGEPPCPCAFYTDEDKKVALIDDYIDMRKAAKLFRERLISSGLLRL